MKQGYQPQVRDHPRIRWVRRGNPFFCFDENVVDVKKLNPSQVSQNPDHSRPPRIIHWVESKTSARFQWACLAWKVIPSQWPRLWAQTEASDIVPYEGKESRAAVWDRLGNWVLRRKSVPGKEFVKTQASYLPFFCPSLSSNFFFKFAQVGWIMGTQNIRP